MQQISKSHKPNLMNTKATNQEVNTNIINTTHEYKCNKFGVKNNKSGNQEMLAQDHREANTFDKSIVLCEWSSSCKGVFPFIITVR